MIPKRSRRPGNPETAFQPRDRAALLDAALGVLIALGGTTYRSAFLDVGGAKYPVALIRSMIRRGLLEAAAGEGLVQITPRGRSIARMIKRRQQFQNLKKEISP